MFDMATLCPVSEMSECVSLHCHHMSHAAAVPAQCAGRVRGVVVTRGRSGGSVSRDLQHCSHR